MEGPHMIEFPVNSIAPLKEYFNQNHSKIKFLALLSQVFLSHFDKVGWGTSTFFDNSVAEMAFGPVSFCTILRLNFSEYGMSSFDALDDEKGYYAAEFSGATPRPPRGPGRVAVSTAVEVTTILTQGVLISYFRVIWARESGE